MGGAHVTEAIGADALYWNPALLGNMDGLAASYMRFEPVPDLTDDVLFRYAAGAGGTREVGGFGVNWMHLDYGLSEATDASGIALGTFRSQEAAVGVGYGRRLTRHFSAGLGFKFIDSDLSPAIGDLAEGKGQTWALDFGILFDRVLADRLGPIFPNGFRWGLAVLNMGPSLQFVENGSPNPLPLDLRTGIGLDVLANDAVRITLAADMNKVLVRQRGGTGTEEFSVDPPWKALFTAWTDEPLGEEFEDAVYSLGVEFALVETLFLRWGVVQDKAGDILSEPLHEEPSPDGVGVKLGPQLRTMGLDFPLDVALDYARFPQATGLAHVERWSLSAYWHFW